MSGTFDRLLNFYETAAFDPATMMTIAAVSSIASATIGAAGQLVAGANAAAMGRYQQKEYAQQAETATATGQRAMLEERRKEGLVESSLQARAAAAGGTSTDPSTLNLGGKIAGRGEYNALMDLSQGQNQAAGLTNMGEAARYSGQIAQQGDTWSAAGTMASGVGSMFTDLSYAKGGLGGYAGMGGQSQASPNYLDTSYNP